MKTVCVTITDRYATQAESVGMRMAVIIQRFLEERALIEQWPKGRGELHWNDLKVSLHLTKVDAGQP